MKGIRLFRLELGRLLRSPLTWGMVLLTVVSPLAGLLLYKPASASTMLTMYLANPSIAGGAAGGIFFGILTVFELNRVSRSRAELLLDAAVSPLTMALVRMFSLMSAALVTLGITMAVWLPISRSLIGSVFGILDYALAYVLFMGLALPLGILSAASAYQITRRVDLSLALFAAFAGLSLTVWADRWQLCWLNPCVWALSDDFSNFRIFRSAAYMRLTWLGALASLWILSWMCIRQYGKGILGSLARSVRHIFRPIIALLLLVCSVTAYAAQPLVDHSNPDQTVFTFLELEYLEGVICSGRTAQIFPDTSAGTVDGKASYQFQNASGQIQTVAFGINPGYTVSAVWVNGAEAAFEVGDYQEFNEAMLEVEIPAEEAVELTVEYGGFPQESRNSSSMQGHVEISEEYLCLENATLAPRLMNVLPDEGMYPAVIEVTLPNSMTVIPFGTGEAAAVKELEDGTVTWRYEDNGTGGILYAGDYIREDIEAGGIAVELYYGRKHQKVMEEVGGAEAVKEVVNYCTEHYGVLSFGTGKALKLIQSRVAGGGYATDGASLLDEADFTAANLGDGSKGAV